MSEKDAADVKVFPPGIPLVTILVGVGLQYFWPITSIFFVPTPYRYWIGGAIILLSIYFFGFKAVSIIRRSGQSENPFKKTTEIIESGPYRISRNPMYSQMVLVCLGFAVLLSNLWILMLTPICALLLHILVILPEEAYLKRKFGDTYLEYQKQTRRWI